MQVRGRVAQVADGEARGDGHGDLRARRHPGIEELAPPMSPTLEEVVATLRRLARASTIELTLNVGETVVEGIFRGNIARLRSRGRRDVSYRKEARRPKLPFSAATLWRSVATFELVQRLPGVAHTQHLGAQLGTDGEEPER